MVNRVVPDEELADKTMRFAERLAAGPTLANAATKRVVRAYLDGGVAAADATTCEILPAWPKPGKAYVFRKCQVRHRLASASL